MSVTDAAAQPARLLSQQRSRLADEVADVLRSQIIAGELASGTQLLQIQLAGRLGVSRTPLREAFRLLERDGLVTISNGNKTVEVAHLGVEGQLHTYQVRSVTDGLAARLAALRDVPAGISARLAQCMQEMEEASDGGLAPARYSEAHAEWHLLLLEASGNGRLAECARLVRVSSHMLITRQLSDAERAAVRPAITTIVKNGNADHRRIIEAISERDPASAERCATRHMERSVKFARMVLSRRTRAAGPAEGQLAATQGQEA